MAAAALLPATPLLAAVSFSGSQREIIEITPDKNSGLENIFVVYDTSAVSMTYTATNGNVTWYRYSNLGGGFAEEISGVSHSGNEYTLASVEGDMGYIIDDGTDRHCFWVVNYLPHALELHSAAPAAEQQCENTAIVVNGSGDAIHYYSVTGQQRTVDRQIEVKYDTQVWNEDNTQYEQQEAVKSFEYLRSELTITPPVYCRTYFHVSGDRFLRQWGMAQEVESELFESKAIEVNTTAEQQQDGEGDEDKKSNQISAGVTGLGGSAPAEISFRSYTTDGVVHHEWQMANDMEFEDITYRITDRDLDYTFMQQGTIYVRYVGSNSDGSCEQYGETYTVTIGDSELKCPNAFSPGASEGVNDEWKVSYRSIIDFECWIFDRYGNEIFHFTDPEQGWDGKRNGKLVKPGVYYYVINATGADGKKYKKSGDINILRYKTYGNGQSAEE